MTHRAVKAIKPDADFNTDGVTPYPDEGLVSGWALPSVLFMSKNGLMTNIKGNFEPKGTTTREQAVVIVVRTFEKYSKLSLETVCPGKQCYFLIRSTVTVNNTARGLQKEYSDG